MQRNPLKAYGQMLKGFREDLYLTQATVAELVGVDKMTISNWENGRRLPRPNHRAVLMRIYNMPPEADLLSCLRMYSKEELMEIVVDLLERRV
jgi:transcriptional regulator with XRE-family HTH domain